MASKKASDGLQDDKFIQMNAKLEKMNQSMREEMYSKLEQMNEASMMKFEQIMGVLSSRKVSDDSREEMYRKQEEANEIRFRNLEDLIQKGHETILLESNRIVTEKLANLSKRSSRSNSPQLLGRDEIRLPKLDPNEFDLMRQGSNTPFDLRQQGRATPLQLPFLRVYKKRSMSLRKKRPRREIRSWDQC
jgi:hypothetical protein